MYDKALVYILYIVRYRRLAAIGGEGSLPLTRDTIWSDVRRNKLEQIGCYQPEDDGFEVVSVSLGIDRGAVIVLN